MSRIGRKWADTHEVRSPNLKEFNLKVGDRIIFFTTAREDGEFSSKAELKRGKVVGIYPHIFHVEYMLGENKMYRSFPKTAYQIGEVVKEE